MPAGILGGQRATERETGDLRKPFCGKWRLSPVLFQRIFLNPLVVVFLITGRFLVKSQSFLKTVLIFKAKTFLELIKEKRS